jgi:hypothetical protein
MPWWVLQIGHHRTQPVSDLDVYAGMGQFIWLLGLLALVQLLIWVGIGLWLPRKIERIVKDALEGRSGEGGIGKR